METIKAGCFLINIERKEIALVYREKQNDYTFPKGHLEENENIEECAIREVAEETKRVCELARNEEPYIERYITPNGESCICYMFIAIDKGHSDNKSEDTHEVHWVPFENVESKLSYQRLKNMWNEIKNRINKFLI